MISKEKFLIYENIRQSGVTNMFDVKSVISLSGGILTKADCIEIMGSYSELKSEYLPAMDTGGGGGVDE